MTAIIVVQSTCILLNARRAEVREDGPDKFGQIFPKPKKCNVCYYFQFLVSHSSVQHILDMKVSFVVLMEFLSIELLHMAT